MPNKTNLKIGDKIRLLKVPKGDLEQREREIEKGLDDAGWTANTIERILAQNPIVEIDEIDEFGKPWFSYDLLVDGKIEHHTLAIMDDDSWELV